MRKFTSIAAALIILASSTGTTIAFHYCGASLKEVAVFGKEKPCCEGVEMPSGCCHDEKVVIKSDDFKVVEQIAGLGFASFLAYEITFPVLDFSIHFKNSEYNFLAVLDNAHLPVGPGIVILVRSFLI